MTIDEAVTDTYFLWTGKATDAPASKRADIILALRRYQSRWGKQVGVDWHSLYTPAVNNGKITAGDAFDLDSSIRTLSKRSRDFVYILHADGSTTTRYKIVEATKLSNYYNGPSKTSSQGHYCARIGKQLVFNHKFSTDDQEFGGTLFIPAFTFADTIDDTNPSDDEVQVDDPDWLTTRAAAALCRNDIVRRSRWPELLAEANDIMARMRDDNEAQDEPADTPWTPFSGHFGGGDEAFN